MAGRSCTVGFAWVDHLRSIRAGHQWQKFYALEGREMSPVKTHTFRGRCYDILVDEALDGFTNCDGHGSLRIKLTDREN